MQTNIPLVATNFVVSGSLHILVVDAVTVIRFYNYNCKYLHTYSNYRCKKKRFMWQFTGLICKQQLYYHKYDTFYNSWK